MRPRLRLGNYEPLLELASGGMATVYIARQVGAAGFERLVVIKRVHRHHLGNREFYRMFVDEARVASLVRHPNVVPVIDTVEQEGELFLVMEYVESSALSTLLKTAARERDRLPPTIAARILADTLAGLHAAHEAVDMRGVQLHIVHRDVSPQNVVVGVDGTSRLIDFGVAKAAHRLTETRSGSLKGKLAYMSPEQAMGQDVDRRVDIFAAGVALHEALTGRRLFQGENDLDTMRRITEMPVPDPSAIAPGIPLQLDAVVQRALRRDPNERFQTAAQFLDALEAAIVPAPAREVGAYMMAKCGDRLVERRARLQEIVEGSANPLSMRLLARDANEPTAVPPAQRKKQGETESQISQVIAGSTRDASIPPQLRPNRAWIGVGVALGAVALVAAIAIVAFSAHKWRKPVAAAPGAPSAIVSVPPVKPATGAEPKKDEVELTISADAKLVMVTAPGVKRSIVDGDHVKLVVAPWTGPLRIDAVLEGNKPASGVAQSDGSRDVKVVPVAVVPNAPKSKTTPKGHGGGSRPNELQDNPYQDPQ